ncbi:fibrillin-1-like isoform X2 [Hydra vulgaris]|uniref:Fibrillin-1-like isoform X2 n=1 Tax=Hydra vulgaris TaxID=6087 RepID=A0ABM4BXB1_HYDVU
MNPLYLALQHLIFYTFFGEIKSQIPNSNVWSSSFETNESDSWNLTINSNRFQRVLYSSISGIVSPQDGDWAISAKGINSELLLPQLAYYGGTITVTFYANSFQPTVLIVRFLKINLELLQEYSLSITNNGWNMYSKSVNNVQYPAFLVSFLYNSDNPIYMDSVVIYIDGKIISCSSLYSQNRCGFTTAVSTNYGWAFGATAVNWVLSLGDLYLKTNFLYLGGSLTGSMNFRAKSIGVSVTIVISVNQTSYNQRISSGYTNFDLTASTQYTVGQTYTLLITFDSVNTQAQLSSISLSAAGKCNLCHPVLTCNKFTNGVTCVCNQNSCLSPNTQCIVSTTDPSIYPCSCLPGYATDIFGNCVDINECNTLIQPCSWSNEVCINTNGSYLCTCDNGWLLGQDNASCVDINECESFTSLCSWSNGACINTNGSYFCSCKNGWAMGQDNSSCVDINECQNSAPPCSWSNGVCVNTNGSYLCSCKNGWKTGQDNASCVDINECQNSAPPCSWSNGVCTNTNGSYLCSCKNGWKIGQDNASCVDINECQSSAPPCSWSNGVCTNTNGSYLCSCKDGWTMGLDNASCVDINECQSSAPPCSWSNGVCSNTNGSYLCSCKDGWTMGHDNASCVDINECQSSAPPCSWSNGVCSNTNGSYLCSCKDGWTMGLDNASCVDINECQSSAPPCSWSNGVCSNTNGSYLCSCKDGWTMGLDNASCVDVNECNSMSPPCSWSNGICINTNGSYFCSCINEWRLGQDNASCVDKCNNTCVYTYSNGIYTNLCKDTNGSLINTTLFKCFDVSECIKNDNCNWNEGICTNSMGSFKCSCHDEWVLGKNNNSCEAPSTIFSSVSMGSFKVKYVPFIEDVVFEFVVVYICRLNSPTDEINLNNCYPALQFNPNTTTTISLGTGNPKTSRKRRAVAYDNSPLKDGEVYSIFFLGYTSDGRNYTSPYSTPLVVTDATSPCVAIKCFSYKNQTCSVVNSTYAKCYCKNGFISFDNLVTCEDINECLSISNVCYKNSLCTNLIGSFMCSCIDGYKFKDYLNGCVDINECETSCNAPNTTCINTIGSYECRCNIPGSFYNTTSGLCQDLNECSSTKPCDSVRGICYNQNIFETGKPYNCSCPSGWELSKDGNNSCVDINECLTSCSGVNAFCINTIGSYKCSCAVGFSLNASSQCQLNNCSCPLNSKCTMNDNFGCTCDFGYSSNYMSNCEVMDQCEGTKNCMKPHQFCQNVYGNFSFICLCRDGYQKLGDDCIAINMSVCNQSSMNNISLCPFNQQCFDTKSSFECRCLTGYEKIESGQCQDINECERNVLACQPNADCINTNGSYYCKCKEGYVGTNVSNTSMMLCYTTSVWSSWEQIGICTERCSTNENQGRLKFQRFCKAIDFSSCNGDFFKEEICNSELCDNKIAILKSIDCQKWPYMQADLIGQSVSNDETWLKKLRTWGGWKAKTCGQLLNDASNIVNQDIENIVKEIKLLLNDRKTLRKVIDCNTYNQQKNSLQRQYIAIYSRLTMYSAIKATLSKLKSRIDVKLNECTHQLTMFGSYASL